MRSSNSLNMHIITSENSVELRLKNQKILEGFVYKGNLMCSIRNRASECLSQVNALCIEREQYSQRQVDLMCTIITAWSTDKQSHSNFFLQPHQSTENHTNPNS